MRTILFVVVLIVPLCSPGQKSDSSLLSIGKNSLFIEFGGNTGGYTLSYDRIFHDKGKWKYSVRGGFTYHPQSKAPSKESWFGGPLEVNFFRGSKNHFFELGLGASLLKVSFIQFGPADRSHNRKLMFLLINYRLGYRFHKKKGGLFIRAAFTPRMSESWAVNRTYNNKFEISEIFSMPRPGFGLSIGYTFKNRQRKIKS